MASFCRVGQVLRNHFRRATQRKWAHDSGGILMRRLFYFLGITAICFLFARPAPAQSFFASLSGTVVDNSGGVAPGAEVTLKGSSTNRTINTNQDGYFAFTELPAGTFEVSVSLKGFNKWVGTGV